MLPLGIEMGPKRWGRMETGLISASQVNPLPTSTDSPAAPVQKNSRMAWVEMDHNDHLDLMRLSPVPDHSGPETPSAQNTAFLSAESYQLLHNP